MRFLITVNLLLLSTLLKAETPDDYFHPGSQLYIHGQKEKSKEIVGIGRQKFPNDPKLNSLAGLLKKEEQQQQKNKQDSAQNKQDQQQKQDQQKQDSAQQDKNEQQKQQEQQAQQNKQDQQKQGQQQQAQQEKQDQQKQGQQQQAKQGEKDKDQQEAQAMQAGQVIQMTPQQALQFLEAQKQQDRTLIFAPPPKDKPQNPNQRLKDW